MKKFFEEFKKFITRGNVLDMAVGVIVGGAFTGIVNGLSNYILKPIINWLLALVLGKDGLSGIVTFLNKVMVVDATTGLPTTEVDLANSIYIDWGSFISAIINFFIIAFVLFSIVKAINSFNGDMAKATQLKKALSKKEVKQLRKEGKSWKEINDLRQKRLDDEAEAKRLADEEAKKNAPKTEQELLAEIVELLKAGKAE